MSIREGEQLKARLIATLASLSAVALLLYSADLLVGSMKLADFFGILGTLVGLVGFAFTIWQLFRVRAAASAAEQESTFTRDEIEATAAITALAEATHYMENSRLRYLDGEWPEAIESAGRAARLLRAARIGHSTDSEDPISLEISSSISQAEAVREVLETSRNTKMSPEVERELTSAFARNIARYSDIGHTVHDRLDAIRRKRMTEK